MTSSCSEETFAHQEAVRYFSDLYDNHKAALFSLAIAILGNKADAEDVLQIVFEKVWRDRANWPQVLQWRPWLLHITRNSCLNQLKRVMRSKRREESVAEDYYFLEPRSSMDSNKVDQLHHILRQLDEPSRSLVLLKLVQELTFEEIGQVLRIPASTVSTRYYETIKRLRALWQKMENQEERI